MAQPLKRHAGFILLSQDNHFGLLLCWKIRKGLSTSMDHQWIMDYVDYFVSNYLEQHFQNEENFLFIYLTKKDFLRRDAEGQHETIRTLYRKMTSRREMNKLDLKEFADQLDSHIRFEEGKLYPYLQTKLQDEELNDFQLKLEGVHHKVDEHWDGDFWIKN